MLEKEPSYNIPEEKMKKFDTALKIVPEAYDLGDVARPLYDIFSDTYHNLCGTI